MDCRDHPPVARNGCFTHPDRFSPGSACRERRLPVSCAARSTGCTGRVAQLVEQGIENPRVGGSIPSPATTPDRTKRKPCNGFSRCGVFFCVGLHGSVSATFSGDSPEIRRFPGRQGGGSFASLELRQSSTEPMHIQQSRLSPALQSLSPTRELGRRRCFATFYRAIRQVAVLVGPAMNPGVERCAGQPALADVLAPGQLGAGVALAGAGGGGPRTLA